MVGAIPFQFGHWKSALWEVQEYVQLLFQKTQDGTNRNVFYVLWITAIKERWSINIPYK